MSYTRNFEFRVSPKGGQRDGGWITPPTGTEIVIGAPVKVNTAPATVNELGLNEVQVAVNPQAPQPGLSGIAVYEFKGQDGWAGVDPYLTTYSDQDTIPVGKALQVVSGDSVKVLFRNTNDNTFLNTRDYTGRTMVSEGSGATPNIDVGDFLTPGAGTDALGYWGKTTIAANAWLVVTKVDDTRSEIEARLLF